jgi:general secretion pathway protein G
VRRRALLAVALLALGYAAYTAFRAHADRTEHQRRESALRANLSAIRGAIRAYRADRGRYPHSLEELVPHYLRHVPADPMTNETDWQLTTEEVVQPNADFTTGAVPAETYVIDVHSRAPRYADY